MITIHFSTCHPLSKFPPPKHSHLKYLHFITLYHSHTHVSLLILHPCIPHLRVFHLSCSHSQFSKVFIIPNSPNSSLSPIPQTLRYPQFLQLFIITYQIPIY
ncbi:hypothetical protein Lalb_Chr25g0282381 [Lupinus albus]|uniref:Uncharacterized protein n=1 Tax=Lupinus albus TaxID=3870 RepID=A0A6A4NBJ3_LUPAL|nr:hypothetical protein Lalb_Chr25g0282381 [Lupinus albus]